MAEPEIPTLKVLYVHNGLGTGGAERSLAELLAGLPSLGVAPLVTCLYRRREGVQREVEQRGVDVRYLPRSPMARVMRLRRIIGQERPDLIHTTIFEADLTGRLAALGGPPVLTSLVNPSYDTARLAHDPNVRRLPLLAARTVDGWTARHLNQHFHALSEAVKRASVRSLRIDPDRVTVVPRGRDAVRLGAPGPRRRRDARSALGLRDDDEVVVNVARQEYQKGQRYLLEAARRLLPRRPRLVLLVAGRRGNATPELERLRRGLGDRVRFLGHRDDVPELLAAADLFVFPSLFEGFGGVLLEAMALAVPIVASDLPVFREVVEPGHNALMVAPASARALADAVDALLDDSSRRAAYGRRGRAIFLDGFTLDRTTAQMVQLYRQLVGRRHGVAVGRGLGAAVQTRGPGTAHPWSAS